MLNKEQTKKLIEERVNELSKDIIKLRQDIHSYPELGYQEFRTTERMSDLLSQQGFDVQTGIATTGFIGTLKGDEEGKTLVLKSSIDGMPISDLKDVPYASKIKNVSHSCGHDIEMAWQWATAVIFKELKRKYGLRGNLKILGQPNEERKINFKSAAYTIYSKGLIDDSDYILEIHPGTRLKEIILPLGSALTTEGRLNALSERFLITAYSQGGHAGIETKNVDLNYVLSKINVRLNEGLGLKLEYFPEDCFIRCPHRELFNSSEGSLADKAIEYGTLRISRDDAREKSNQMYKSLVKIVEETAEDNRISPIVKRYYKPDEDREKFDENGIILEFWQGPGPLYNDSYIIKTVEEACRQFKVDDFKKFKHSGGNDISFYSESTTGRKIPIGNIALGAAKGDDPPKQHTSYFDIDEKALPLGAKIMAFAASKILYENDT